MHVNEGNIIFKTTKSAFNGDGFVSKKDDNLALIVWFDNLTESDFYSKLMPWQIVNRIPNINFICRKAPFVILVNRMQLFFPTLYTFYPFSIVLPNRIEEFKKLISLHNKKYIVKPDGGSLGYGIKIIDKDNDDFTNTKNLEVAQEYVDSLLLDDIKFDLRIYVLIASVKPLTIYVYRDGIARFCSEKSGSESLYSQITNTAINKKNPSVDINSITQMVHDVFQKLEGKGIDTSLLWAKMDNAIILTVLSVLKFLEEGLEKNNIDESSIGYSRCFQILGFDFIIDKDLNPLILEVNYRPSLSSDTNDENKLKIDMLRAALRIVAPFKALQKIIIDKNLKNTDWVTEAPRLKHIKCTDPHIDTGLFQQIYPTKSRINNKIYDTVKYIALKCPTNLKAQTKLPVYLKKPAPNTLPKVNLIDYNTAAISEFIKYAKKKAEYIKKNSNNGPIKKQEINQLGQQLPRITLKLNANSSNIPNSNQNRISKPNTTIKTSENQENTLNKQAQVPPKNKEVSKPSTPVNANKNQNHKITSNTQQAAPVKPSTSKGQQEDPPTNQVKNLAQNKQSLPSQQKENVQNSKKETLKLIIKESNPTTKNLSDQKRQPTLENKNKGANCNQTVTQNNISKPQLIIKVSKPNILHSNGENAIQKNIIHNSQDTEVNKQQTEINFTCKKTETLKKEISQNGHANTQSINQDSPNHFPNEKDKALEINEMKASEKHKTHTDTSHPKQEKLMSNIDQSKQTKIDKSTKLNICNNQNNTKSHINIHDSANFTINSNSKVHYPSSKEQNSQNLNKKIIQVENNKKIFTAKNINNSTKKKTY